MDPTFVVSYVAYHHYRSCGWIPKSGLKYGVDYVLYSNAIATQHAQYAVFVAPTQYDQSKQPLSWTTVSRLNRLAEQVAKGAILCNIVFPQASDTQILHSPEYLPQFEVIETVLDRWKPTQTRSVGW